MILFFDLGCDRKDDLKWQRGCRCRLVCALLDLHIPWRARGESMCDYLGIRRLLE